MTSKNNVFEYISELNQLSININQQLIEKYKLHANLELSDFDNFELGMMAAKKKIINRSGEFKKNAGKIEYVFHGTGVTFKYNSQVISFEYYPKTEPIRLPIFGLLKLFEFIESKGEKLTMKNKGEIEEILNLLEKENKISFPYSNFSSYYVN